MKTRIDATDVRIVEELRKNARITMKELGARVFLTGQAVRNRVERLEDMGILQRYTINVNCPVFGYKVHAVIRVQLRHGPVVRYQWMVRLPSLRQQAFRASTGPCLSCTLMTAWTL